MKTAKTKKAREDKILARDEADKNVLQLAAKAAGMHVLPMPWPDEDGWFFCRTHDEPGLHLRKFGIHPATHFTPAWKPLTDDGDALRLAVKLHLYVKHFPFLEDDTEKYPGFLEVWGMDDSDPVFVEYLTSEGGRLASTRHAIVRAAASIGKKS